MSRRATVLASVDPEIEARLEALARAQQRSPSALAADAIEQYVAVQEWQIEHIRQGLDDAENGRLLSHDRVKAWIASWGTETELPELEPDGG